MRGALLLVAALLAGCAPERGEAYLVAFAAGERAFHAGRYVEAARALEQAAARARRVKDRDEARFFEARCYERAGMWAEARAILVRLATESPGGPRAERVAFELAQIEIQQGDAARGWAMLDDAVRRHPSHGLTRPSIRRLVEHAEETGGARAALAWLDANAATFRGTEQEEVIGYERACVLERAGNKQEAHDAFIASARRHPYPFGGFTDDSFWHAAQLDEELGRPEEAIVHLRELLSSREPSSSASYERPRFPHAQLRIAEIYRDKLEDRAAARREFERFYDRFPKALERDDALWAQARLALEDHDQEAACKLAQRFLDELPASRYTPCAHELCPTVKRAQRGCAGYILRELRGAR